MKTGNGGAPDPGHGIAQPHCPPVQTGLELDRKTGNGDAPDPGHGTAEPLCPPVQTGYV